MALAEKLGFSFYDQEIIKMAAVTTGYTQDFISKKEESMTIIFFRYCFPPICIFSETSLLV